MHIYDHHLIVFVEQVTRVTSRFCKCLILAVNDVLLKEPFHGLLRSVYTFSICIFTRNSLYAYII